MTPQTIMDMLKLKLHIGNKRKLGNGNDAIKAQEDMINVEAGRNVEIGENLNKRYWKETWVDEINNLL